MQRTKLYDDSGAPAGAGAKAPAFIVVGAVGDTPYEGVLDILAEAGLNPQDAAAAKSLSRGVLTTTDHARATSTQMPVLPPQAADAVGAPSDWLEQVPEAHVLMLFSRPETFVARAMDQGQLPSQPLNEWGRHVEELLRLYRRNRRRVTLLDADAAMAAPEACVHHVEERLGVRLAQPSRTAPKDPSETDVVHQAIAALAVQKSEAAQDLYAELEASALPLGEHTVDAALDVDRAFHAYANDNGEAQRAQEQKQENELLLTQLHQVQEELESSLLKAREVEQERDRLQAELAKTKQSLEMAQSDRQDKEGQLARLQEDHRQLQDRLTKAEEDLAGKEDLKQENELLLLQLHQVQEELETYYLESQNTAAALRKLEDKLAAREETIKNKNWAIDKKEEKYQAMLAKKKQLERDLKATKTRLERIKRSASWKVTAPVRAVRRPFATKPDNTRSA